MPPESTRTFSEIGTGTLNTMVDNFLETVGNLTALKLVSPNEQAQAIEHIGRRLRDEFCGGNLRGHALWAKEILTVATRV